MDNATSNVGPHVSLLAHYLRLADEAQVTGDQDEAIRYLRLAYLIIDVWLEGPDRRDDAEEDWIG